ncbi:tyrosine--tRNA ligase [Symbiobacterium thermophilum]|uniref:Tyrosine--tRNA ligase n=2 Tax=Symbiobacterium thermophilum TaxID=2734 RepID=SYY_SYMTH|nr:tyrosine--tRNA ligase [Symbiobacterium thermophilum]Q67QD6.1 RecName: Full=Tyrosine--tRNA ligase; AltName: Full=Tyrosyl-tRNA synthetase; Short=TyrRS [Symbiobacterium thermophilum IAM 14863]MBY6277624.1 tyrosine--tRNA ligase [Symbiobacterium thermophilum]BAD40107.1 tyrosyl-tRNA synthetase [Symbiobacterium thermophilum IAM 14863]
MTMAFMSVDEQMKILMRGVVDLVSEEELRQKLERSVKTGRPLRVKLGIDPTGKDLTLGHTVPLRKLRDFVECGHQGVLIIGDYTAMVGDPTGRNEARPQLTHAETTANAQRYLEQAARVLDVSKLEIRRNSEWLAPMSFSDVIRLAAKSTVARMLEREDFKKRYEEGRPIFIHEFFYPLMQGTDSVAVQADVELGGTDQKFNLLAGRDLQRDAGQEPQVCLMTPIVEGLDGVQKMSKSLGNYIGLDHTPDEMFGRTMSIPDSLIITYFTYFTDVPQEEIERIEAAMAAGENPMTFKKQLGRAIITTYGGTEEEARLAEERWVAQFSRGEVPEDIPDVVLPAAELPMQAARVLFTAGLAPSLSEARRLIEQGGFTVDGEKVTDPRAELALRPGQVLKAGKRKYGRVVLK